ncbi:MAG: hypothetical protein M3138_00225 [Actinomycetota bacterium]|nr:hypothetical protein [Actinomycetota bacterium]
MNARTLGRILCSGALALLLTGCFKVNMDVEVSPENTVSGSAIIAVDESLLELSGQSADQLFREMDLSDLPAGATSERYEEDGFIGQEITFEEMPLETFTQNNALSGSGASAGAGEELNIARRGDEFHVTGAFDMTGAEFTGTQIPEQFLESFEFRISITFPGEVRSATGEIDGNTVTWEPQIGENTPVEAVASALPSESSPLLMILLVAAGALVLGAIAFLLTHRKAPAPAAGPMGDGTTVPVEGIPPTMPESPAEPVAPIDHPPSPPEAPGSAVPAEDEAPPPSSPA